MKKAMVFFAIAAACIAVTFHFFHPDFSWIMDAFGGDSGPVAAMDQPAPHAVLPSVDNDWVDFASYKGQVVLVAFWTTWCPGCVDEVPELIQMQQNYFSRGFTVVAIAVNDRGEQSVETFVREERFQVAGASTAINYPVLLGNDEVARKFGFEGGLPMCILVNREGKEVNIIRGPVEISALSKAIRRLL
jgi:thiol-disulfide isomerase/thioredoxin